MKQKPTRAPVEERGAKNGLKNDVGTVAMARTIATRTRPPAQFFINVKDNDFLN